MVLQFEMTVCGVQYLQMSETLLRAIAKKYTDFGGIDFRFISARLHACVCVCVCVSSMCQNETVLGA